MFFNNYRDAWCRATAEAQVAEARCRKLEKDLESLQKDYKDLFLLVNTVIKEKQELRKKHNQTLADILAQLKSILEYTNKES